ncbi:MAG: glycosyltransferase [Candidatus Binatia bacterium]|nr:glycosyltransferase [Candidatus Binatia bacterium]
MKRPATTKRLSHRLKSAWYSQPGIDAVVDQWLHAGEANAPVKRWLREQMLFRLLPERRLRETPFTARASDRTGRARVLSLVPPEDTGGGSRPAQIAAELHRRGFEIEWLWALPVFPWPRRSQPQISGVDAHHIDSPPAFRQAAPADVVLLEAPHPRLYELARSGAGDGPLIYDAIDVWDGSLGTGWYDRAVEERVLREADHLVASAKLLRDELSARSGRDVALLPNAIDLGRFGRSEVSSEKLERGDPTVAYVGALWGEWVDLDLIEHLAKRCPAATIHLIGPQGDQTMPRAANIRTHGPRERHVVPGLLRSADVAIVPFAPSRLSAAVSPLKVFEYLAMERPVVSTRLPDLEGVPGVTIADDADGFAEAVQRVAREPFPRDLVRSFLADHTWERRADQLLELTRSVRG